MSPSRSHWIIGVSGDALRSTSCFIPVLTISPSSCCLLLLVFVFVVMTTESGPTCDLIEGLSAAAEELLLPAAVMRAE